jgi:tetratricopeptide (TPR) repeat protein
LKLDNKHFLSWFHKGGAHLHSGRWEEARKCYEVVIELNPKFDVAYMNIAITYAAQNQIEDAIIFFDTAFEINPNDDAILVNKGNALNQFKRFDEALVCFDKALKINPKNAVTLANKGATLSNLDRNKKALKCLNKALKIEPGFVTAQKHKQIVMNKLNKKKPKPNTKLLDQKVIDLHNSGTELYFAKKYQEAANKFLEEVKIAPLFDKAWFMLAICYAGMKLFSEALKGFDKALELNPKNEDAWQNKGNIYIQLALSKGNQHDCREDYSKAIECYNNVLKINPQHVNALNNKRILLERIRRLNVKYK